MQTLVQDDLARVWRYWRWIRMDSCNGTHSCHWLGIQFPHRISHQAWSSPIVLITLLHLSSVSVYFPTGISFTNFLVYSICLFSLTPSFSTLFRISFQNFISFYYLNSLTYTFRSQKKITIKIKNKTTNLTKGRWQSLLFLTISGAILRPLLSISALLFLILPFKAPSLLHCGPNPLQLGHIPLLALYKVPEGPPNSSVLLHKFLECFFNGI